MFEHKRKNIKIAAFAVLALSMLVFLTSCKEDKVVYEQHRQTEITLSWWGNDTRNEYTLEAVSLFEAAYPEIKVKCSYSEWSGYESRNQVRMISGNETDVMQINVGWLKTYSKDGTGYYDIEKLSEYVDLSNFSDQMLKYGRMNGVLNAIPIAMNAETVYINKTVYDKYGLDIPKTWDDFFKAAKVMKGDEVYPLAGANKSIWLYTIAYAEQVLGKQIVNSDSKLVFDKDDLKVMMDFYIRMVNEQVIPKIEDFQRFNIDNAKYAGIVAWVSDAMNYFKNPIEAGQEIIVDDYTVMDGCESGEGWYAKPATLYAVSKNTAHPKEAAELLNYMLNSNEWAELQGVEKGIPVSTAARAALESKGMLSGLQYEASLVMENNKVISPMDSVLEESALYNAFFDACDQVLFDRKTLDEAVEELNEAIAPYSV